MYSYNPIEQEAWKQRQRVEKLVSLYQRNPMQFASNQVDELREMAEATGVNFKTKEERFDARRNAKNLMGGFIEGFTTIPTGTKPKTTYEAISHSMGHLAGFAPGILSVPFNFLGKGAVGLGLKRVGKALFSASRGAAKLNKYSVPMFFGHKAVGLMNKGLSKSGLEAAEFLKKGSAGRAIAEEATSLGIASGVSSIWKGPEVMWDGMVHGAVAGGMFGGLGNFTAIGNYLKSKNVADHRKGEQLLKGAIGAGLLGVPAYLRDEPVEMIMYETLLGGYFGYQGRPAKEREGGKFVEGLAYEEAGTYMFRPEAHPEWNNYSKGAKDYIKKQVDEYTYKYIVPKMEQSSGMTERQIMDNFAEMAKSRYKTEIPSEEMIKNMIKEEAEQYWIFARKGYRMDWESVSKEHNMEYAREDIDQDVVVSPQPKAGQEKTPLEKTRGENQQVKEVYIAEVNPDGTVTFVKKAGTYGSNTIVGETNFGKTPAEKLEGTTYFTMDNIYVAGSDAGTLRKTVKPMEYQLNDKGLFEHKVNTEFRYNIYDGLKRQGKYIFGGIKDKGVYTLRDYHLDAEAFSKDQLIKSLANNDKKSMEEAYKSYNEGLSIELEWLGLKSSKEGMNSIDMNKTEVRNVIMEYNKQWKSNVLAEAERQGYYVTGSKNTSNLYNLMKEGHTKNVIDWNKRQQLYQDKSYSIDPNAVNSKGERIFAGLGGKLQYQIFNDVNTFGEYFRRGKDGNPELANYESWTDGIIVFRPEIYDKVIESVGLPKSNMNKPVITVRMPDGGVMIVKSAGQRLSNKSDKSMIDMMNERGLDSIIFTSSAKHTGNTKPLDIGFNKESGTYNPPEFRPLEMPIDSIRMNLGTLVDPRRALKPQIIVTQLSSNINEVQAPGGQKLFYNEIMAGGPKGTKEAIDIIDRYRQTSDKTELKNLDIDDIPTQLIHSIFTRDANLQTRTKQDAELAKIIARKIAKMDKEGGLEDVSDFTAEQYKQYVYRNNRVLDTVDFDMVFRHNLDYSSKYFDNVYKKYMINRYIKPKWKYSGKSWLGGVLPHNQSNPKMKVNKGEIKLDNGMGEMKFKLKHPDGKIEETTLWEAWTKYGKKKGYEKNFELTVVRVPMDSLSGARILKFTGFTNSKGHSARTHAKDDWYLGGADKDSDSIFIYQGFSSKVKDIYKKQTNEWGEGTFENPMVEKKSAEMDKLFGIDFEPSNWNAESFSNPFSQFNPSMRKVVADQAYKGTTVGLGYGLKGKKSVMQLMDLIPEGQAISIQIKTGSGKNDYGTMTIKSKENGHYNVRRLGMEIVNRSADSANYPISKNPGEYRDMLIKEAFDIKIKNHEGKVSDGKFKDLVKHYKNIQMDNMLDPKAKNWNTGQSYNLEQWQRKLDKLFTESEPIDSLSWLTSNAMATDGILKNIKPYSAKIEEYAKAMEGFKEFIHSDPFYRKFAVIGKISFDPMKAVKSYENAIKKGVDPEAALRSFEWKVNNDMFTIGSYRAITKQGYDIYKYMRDELQLKSDKGKALDDIVIEQVLRPINEKVQNIKRMFDNIKNDAEKSSAMVETFDSAVKDLNLELGIFANKYAKVYGADAKKLYKMMKDYVDIGLIGNLRPYGGKGGPNQIAIQSQEISSTALKKILMSHKEVYKTFTQAASPTLPTPEGKLLDIVPKNYYEAEAPNQVVNSIVNRISVPVKEGKETLYKKPIYKNKVDMTPGELAKSIAVKESDFKAIELFESNLKKNKNIADNFDAWFIEFTNINEGGIRRDVSTFSMKDVHNFNRWFKDIDRRFIQSGKGLPPYAWRVDPRYINEQMALFEGKVFASYEAPVLTSDGPVKRQVKNFTGTMGIIRDMFRRTNMQIDKYSALDLAENERLYKFRKQLTKEQAHGINEIVIAKRNGEDILQNKWYEKLKNEIFIYDGKTKNMEQMVEIIDNIYTKDFQKFGNQWLWSRDTTGQRVDWSKIDINKEYGIVNDYFKYNADGSVDINHFLRKLTSGLDKGLDLPRIGLENLLRFQYEYKIEKIISDKGLMGAEAKKFREQFREGKLKFSEKFQPIGDQGKDYFPRIWENTTKARQAEIDAWMAAKIAEVRENPEMMEAILRAQHEMSKSETGGTEKHAIDDIVSGVNYKNLTDQQIANHLNNIGFFNRPGSSLERTGEKPGWDRDLNTIDIYKDKFIRSYYKNLQSILVNNRIDTFVKEGKFGEHTGEWADFLRIYARDSFGHQSTFERRVLDDINMSKGERGKMGLGGTIYYNTSDHRIIKAVEWIDKKFADKGWKVPFFKNIPKVTAEQGTPLYQKQVQARREYLSRMIHNFGKMEAKYNLMTLLANTGTMTANVFGGSTMTISQGGLKNFARSYNNKWLHKNLLTNAAGEYVLKYTDPATGKIRNVTNKKQLRQWAAEQGIIDKFITDEIGINLALKTGLKGRNAKAFAKELSKILRKNPDASNETILELARRYGVQSSVEKAGAWFMQKSERIARTDAFLTHAIQFKERWGAKGYELKLDDPAVIDAGLKGVEATQFLYHSAFRPAYMRTSLGKVLTRFKLFAFQSVRTRKELYRQAKHYGFEEGTPAFERFKDLFLIDMFTMALGTAFTYSLFDTALPPPYDWIQETGEWLFGDKRERERAFFGQWPYPVAPLQVATPPIARIPMAAFSSLINNDWERFADYHIHTMYPFGRIVRQVDQTIDEPYGTTFGRGMQQFFRLPTDKLVSKLNKAQIDRDRKDLIDSEIEQLGEII